MPSLFRFLIVLVVLGVLGGAAMIYLANFVGPHTREMTVRVPVDKLIGHSPWRGARKPRRPAATTSRRSWK
ncbi:hypothetical protein BH10PSE9_BH10PSE9_01800 [soil metagenome]